MIAHFVGFTWVEGTTSAQVEGLTAALHEMVTLVPELRSYTCGPNLRLRPSPADFGVMAIVDDEAALDAYLDSAAHADVQQKWLGAMIAERTAVQLRIDPGLPL